MHINMYNVYVCIIYIVTILEGVMNVKLGRRKWSESGWKRCRCRELNYGVLEITVYSQVSISALEFL